MKEFKINTKEAVNVDVLMRMREGDPNARLIFDAIHATGVAADPDKQNLLNPSISIVDPFDPTKATVKFKFPFGKELDAEVEVSDYQLVDHDPIIVTFSIKAGKRQGKYKIVKDDKTNTWDGFYIVADQPLYALRGEFYVKN